MPGIQRIGHRRGLALLISVALLAGGTSAAAAPSQDEVDSAFEKSKQLLNEASAARAELDSISTRVQALAERLARQQGTVEQITADLDATEQRVAELEGEYDRVSARLDERAVQAFMTGPANTVGLLLGSSRWPISGIASSSSMPSPRETRTSGPRSPTPGG